MSQDPELVLVTFWGHPGQTLPELSGFAHGGAAADVIQALSCWEAPGSELCVAPNPAASAAPRLQTLSVSIIN